MAITDVRPDEQGKAAVNDIMSETCGRALYIRADVTDAAAIDAAIEQTSRELGNIDILLNNGARACFDPGVTLCRV